MNGPSPTRKLARRLWAAALVSLAGVLWFLRTGELPQFEGKPLREWVASGRDPEDARSLAQAFHAAGPDGIRLLLDELEAPSRRLVWLHYEFDVQVGKMAKATENQSQQRSPPQRASAAAFLINKLPVPEGLILGLATNRFQALARELRGKAPPEPRRIRIGSRLWDSTDLLRAKENTLHRLAQWIGQNRSEGTSFLDRQLSESDSPLVHQAILASVYTRPGIRRDAARIVPGLVRASRSPVNELDAATLLTSLRAEPSVAIPILVRHALTDCANCLSLVAEWGTNAAPWLPQILPLTTNTDLRISIQAASAVRKLRDGTELPANP